MTDSAGNVVQTYVYDIFGNIVQQTGNVENVYTYTGREWDAEAGLYYYRARYYDPTLGRFINGDPIGFAGGDVNFYVYVQNNPVNLVDPWGLIRPDFFDKDFYKRNKAGTQAFIEAFNEYNKGRSKKLKCDMNEAYEAYQEDVGTDHTRPPLPSPIEYSLLIKGLSELIGALVADYTKYGVGTTVDYGRAMYEGIKASQNYTSP